MIQLLVAIFRHTGTEGPGYLSKFLDQRQIPWQLIAIDAGDAVPSSALAYSGLVFMGGPMSVNDDLPWIPKVETLIRGAVARDIPVLGHCLGGQLISKALGGVVSRNPVKEIGWGEVKVSENEVAHAWFGDVSNFSAFHWHGETFTLPQGATHLLSSAHCANQAYSIGKHLALQCHVEMTADMVRDWAQINNTEIAQPSATIQSAAQMTERLPERIRQLHQHADLLYTRWLRPILSA